jgi:uncharacterized protein DUF3179
VSVRWRRSQLAAGLAGLLALAACSAPSAPARTESQSSTPIAPATIARTAAATPTTAALPTAVTLSDLRFSTRGWKTNFSRAAVPLSELESGGPPRDGIPPIDQPKFVSGSDATTWLTDEEPVIAFQLNGEARAYPLQILVWHEIVDDEVADTPVLITFCPLCNTAIAFDRRVDGKPLRFGTTGNLRDSDLVMWSDDPGETWWQQITGEAIVGDLVGSKLTMLPAEIVSFADFKAAFPTGQVLSRDTGHPRGYGSNPYVGYDNISSSPFLYSGPKDGRLPPMERVATVELNGETAAYPFRRLVQVHAVNDSVGGAPVVVFHRPGTRSALDGSAIASSRDIGAAAVFDPTVRGQILTFSWRNDQFVDDQTGSTWDILGRATDGALAGSRLQPVISGNHFWFAWAAFKPDTRIWAP